MLDREKVIERLGKVSYYFKSLRVVGWQDDADIYREHQESVNMAIALLQEQEPVRPRWTHPTIDMNVVMCGSCGIAIPLGKPNYCPWCGRKVKWDD